MPTNLKLQPMQTAHQSAVLDIILQAMDAQEAEWAAQTFAFYFSCLDNGIDPKRRLYVGLLDGEIIGVTGLHEYRWGPPQNVWLSWFAVHPGQQGQGHGKALLTRIEQIAAELGYHKMFIETYSHPTFGRAREFYRRQGYGLQGRISDYLPDGSDMSVCGKRLVLPPHRCDSGG